MQTSACGRGAAVPRSSAALPLPPSLSRSLRGETRQILRRGRARGGEERPPVPAVTRSGLSPRERCGPAPPPPPGPARRPGRGQARGKSRAGRAPRLLRDSAEGVNPLPAAGRGEPPPPVPAAERTRTHTHTPAHTHARAMAEGRGLDFPRDDVKSLGEGGGGGGGRLLFFLTALF